MALAGREQGLREVHCSGRLEDRVHDRLVAGAAAEVARKEVLHLVAARPPTIEQVARRHQDAGSAEAALERVVLPEGRLQRRQLAVSGEPLHRLDPRAVHLRREHEAGANGGAVDPDRAGAADAVLAADVRAPQPQLMAQEVREQQPRLHLLAAEPAVDLDRDRNHGASNAFRQARPTARSTRTRVSCFRYAGEAWRFPGGSTAAAATSPASRAASASTARPASPTSTTSGRSATEPTATRPCSTRPSRTVSAQAAMTEAVVAAPLRQLLERVARAGWRGGPDRVDDELVRLERREEVRDEELVRRDRSLSSRGRRDDGSTQDGQRERKLRSGIRMGDRAADRAAVAGCKVADVRERLGHERQAVAHELRGVDRRLAGQRADPDAAVLRPDRVEARDPVQVDEDGRAGPAGG